MGQVDCLRLIRTKYQVDVCTYVIIYTSLHTIPAKYQVNTCNTLYSTTTIITNVKYQVDAHTQSKANSMIQVDCLRSIPTKYYIDLHVIVH